jgi:nucleoside diphosphate kinase
MHVLVGPCFFFSDFFLLIKVKAGVVEIITRKIEDDGVGMSIVQSKKVILDKISAEQFYQEHAGKPFFKKLVTFMTRYAVLHRR